MRYAAISPPARPTKSISTDAGREPAAPIAWTQRDVAGVHT